MSPDDRMGSMACKFTYLLARNEVETYRTQGLHREALALYTDLLSTSENLDPALKNAVQGQIVDIEAEMVDFASQREAAASCDIFRISQGWDERTSETYMLLCADALCSVGSYGDALEEFKTLLRRGGWRDKYRKPMVDCLIGLYPPGQLPDAVDALAAECLPQRAQSRAFQLALAKELSRHPDKQWAIALYRHLRAKGNLPSMVVGVVDSALSELGVTHDFERPSVSSPTAMANEVFPQGGSSSKRGLVLERVRSAFKAIIRTNEWAKGYIEEFRCNFFLE
jgi:hypothetical protein